MSQANKVIKNRGFAPIVSRETNVILGFSEKIENKGITLGAPKLYHIILARVKLFRITYFSCVFVLQHFFVVQFGHGQKSTFNPDTA